MAGVIRGCTSYLGVPPVLVFEVSESTVSFSDGELLAELESALVGVEEF